MTGPAVFGGTSPDYSGFAFVVVKVGRGRIGDPAKGGITAPTPTCHCSVEKQFLCHLPRAGFNNCPTVSYVSITAGTAGTCGHDM